MDLGQTQRLITRALQTRDADATGDMLEHLRPRLVLWATTRLSSGLRAKLEPDDVAQETLLAVHKSLGSFDGTDYRAFLAWVFKIGENRIRDLADHFGAEKRRPGPPLTFSQTSPSSVAVRSEQVKVVATALETLPEAHAEVIRLRRFELRTVSEIAELLGKSDNAVRILYCRALKALRAALGADGTVS